MASIHSGGAFLYTTTLSICAGVAAVLLFQLNFFACVLLLGGAVLFLLLSGVLKKKEVTLVAIALCACAFGIMRGEVFLDQENAHDLSRFAGSKAQVEGIVVQDPDKRDTSLHLTVEVTRINGTSAQGKLLAIVPKESAVVYNDSIDLAGVIVLPQPFLTNTGHLFDYPGYLRVQGISVEMLRATLVSTVPGPWSVQGTLFYLKHLFEQSIEKLFPEPDNSLLEGILLGERRGIPKDLTNAFIASGLVHVVVLSGHNITVVSEGVFRVLGFLPRTLQFGVGGLLMLLFALMTGAGATTVRALVMALVALLARYMHRSALAMRSLAVAGAAMVLWNPNELLHDPSFILSMLATFGLVTLAPWVEQKIAFIPNFKKFNVRSIAASTIAVEIFVTPALLYFTGVLSLFALPANIVVLPVVPTAMLLGFIAGVLGFIHPMFGFAPMVIGDILLKWMIGITTIVQSLPFSTTTVSEFSPLILIAVYIPLTAFAIWCYLYFSAIK